MSGKYTVGVDFGTESGRAVLVDCDDGRELGTAVYRYRNGVIDERLPQPDDDVRLDAEWDNRPTFAEAGDTPVTVKAIYEVVPTAASGKFKVWAGRIESANYKFTLRHW